MNDNLNLKVKEMAARVETPKSTVLKILRDRLNMRKISAKWVQKLLSSAQKLRKMEHCREFLNACQGSKSKVILSIATGDEPMITKLLYQKKFKGVESPKRKPPLSLKKGRGTPSKKHLW